ncbi:MAG: urease accessory protein UreE [Flavitalea sp.]
MTITSILGNTFNAFQTSVQIDYLSLEWYECTKRILHKTTSSGSIVTLRFLQQPVHFKPGDVLYQDDQFSIVVKVNPCKSMVIHPASEYELASACYELGNKHLPLFYENGCLVIPFDAPVYKMLSGAGFNINIEESILSNPLRTSVLPHAHESQSQSLFSRILKFTGNEK